VRLDRHVGGTKVLFRRSCKGRLLLHSAVRARPRDDRGATRTGINRVATVVSGEWHFGYGEHFAQTAETAVVVQISGYGPTDTKYFDPANDPANKK